MTDKQTNERGWTEWHQQFEAREIRTINNRVKHVPPKCLYAVQEGQHRRACRKDARFRSPDGYPACGHHKHLNLRDRWQGFVEGA